MYDFLMTAVTQLTNNYVHMLHNEQVVSRASATYSSHNQSGSMMAILLLQQTDDIHTVLKSGHNSLGGGGYSHWGGGLFISLAFKIHWVVVDIHTGGGGGFLLATV